MTLSDMLLHDTFDYRNSDLVIFDGISQTIDFFGTRLSRLLRKKLREKRTSHEVIYFFRHTS